VRKPTTEFDYKSMVPNIMNKKRFLRKSLVTEYLKEYKKIVTSDFSNRAETIHTMKMDLIGWYCKGLREVVVEEAERTEFGMRIWLTNSRAHDVCEEACLKLDARKNGVQTFKGVEEQPSV
jgi:hypothetical protein